MECMPEKIKAAKKALAPEIPTGDGNNKNSNNGKKAAPKKKKGTPEAKATTNGDTNNSNNGGGKHGTNFFTEELESFLDTLEDVLPVGSAEWDQVATAHHDNGFDFHESKNLHKKCQAILCKAMNRVPTGNPNIPKQVHCV